MPITAITSQDRREKKLSSSKRFRDGRFWNTSPVSVMSAPDFSVMKNFVTGGKRRIPKRALPLFAGTAAALSSPSHDGLRLTWLGHSTVLIEIDGVRLLTDPVFGERASPLPFAGPKRFHKPPLALSELGRVDAVVLSHDHYDHLCAPTVRALVAGACPDFSGRFVTALGVGAHLEKLGVRPELIDELDWGEGVRVEGAVGATVDVTATPSQHFSGRGADRKNGRTFSGHVT